MIAELQCTVVDCPEPQALAAFYARLLGGEVDRPDRRWALDPGWSTLHLPSGAVLAFQRVPAYRPPTWPAPEVPQQFHLDLSVADPDAARREILAAGGTLLEEGTPGRGWQVYADPAGHPLCVLGESPAEDTPRPGRPLS